MSTTDGALAPSSVQIFTGGNHCVVVQLTTTQNYILYKLERDIHTDKYPVSNCPVGISINREIEASSILKIKYGFETNPQI